LLLLLAVLLSDLAARSILSTSVLFLVAGFVLGEGVLGVLHFQPGRPVELFLELALFLVLYTDGMRIGVRELSIGWHDSVRALLVGMPLTFAFMALLIRWLMGLNWPYCVLLAAALSPTDPVLVSAIVGREEVPRRLRHLLNVESGFNDGLALPVVLYLLAKLGGDPAAPTAILVELGGGVVLGLVIPWAAIQLERLRFFSVHVEYLSLYAVAVGLLVLGASSLLRANIFLAAFSAGISTGSSSSRLRDEFQSYGALFTELAKLSGLLVFGALLTPTLLFNAHDTVYLLAFLILFLARPAALALSLLGTDLTWPQILAAGWFGPKGFATAVLGLMILQAGIAQGESVVKVIGLVIAGSIILHSSTDVLVARWFRTHGASEAVES
jgi:NhaP-type Na+/H+ or K+/H+ antiporter